MDQPIKKPGGASGDVRQPGDDSPGMKMKPAPAATAPPQVKLKTKLKPLEEAQKIAAYLETLKPVNFIFSPTDEQNKKLLPLPIQTAEILYQEGVLDREGQLNWENTARIQDPDFVRQLENKVLFAIVRNTIDNQIYIALRRSYDTPELQHFMLEDDWGYVATFLAEHYAPSAAAVFMSERYPDRLTGTAIVQRLPLEFCNRKAMDNIRNQVTKDADKIRETIDAIISYSRYAGKIRDINQLLDLSTERTLAAIPDSCYFSDNLDVAFSQSPSGEINLHTVLSYQYE